MTYEGIALTKDEEELLTSTLRASNHPLSRSLYDMLKDHDIRTLDSFEEKAGKGIAASIDDQFIKVGSYQFVSEGKGEEEKLKESVNRTAVHISSNNLYKGCYVFQNKYREGLSELLKDLSKEKKIVVLSGDNDGERERLMQLAGYGTKLSGKSESVQREK